MDEVDLIICQVGPIRSGSGHVESSRVGFVFFVCNFQIGVRFFEFWVKISSPRLTDHMVRSGLRSGGPRSGLG